MIESSRNINVTSCPFVYSWQSKMSLSALGSWRQALIAPRQINEHWPAFGE
jgi:hypothetical protein